MKTYDISLASLAGPISDLVVKPVAPRPTPATYPNGAGTPIKCFFGRFKFIGSFVESRVYRRSATQINFALKNYNLNLNLKIVNIYCAEFLTIFSNERRPELTSSQKYKNGRNKLCRIFFDRSRKSNAVF